MIEVLVAETWDRVRDVLQRELGPKVFELWFGQARVIQLRRGVMSVGLPNDFVRDWVHEHYGALLTRLASDAVGSEIRVDLLVDPELTQRLREQATAHVENEDAEPVDPTEGKTFDSFVVTAGAELAVRALRHVAKRARPDLNPLLVVGPEGVGKSHLASAVVSAFPRPSRTFRIGGEEFARRFSWHLKTRRIDELRNRIIGSDLVIFEDMQALSGKVATQREISMLVQSLVARRSQVVLVSREHPAELVSLEPGLHSVVMSGMMVEVAPPSRDEKVAILEHIFTQAHRRVPRSVVELVVDRLDSSVKRLDREIRKIYAFAGLTGDAVTADWLDRHGPALSGPTDPDQRRFETILRAVLDHFEVEREALLSKRKTKSLGVPRGMVVHLLREQAGLTFKEIGRLLGERSHTSVYLLHQKFETRLTGEPKLQQFAREVGRMLVTAGTG